MVAPKRHGIEDLTLFAMEVIRSSGEKALSYYGKGNRHIKFDEALITEADSHLMNFFQSQLNTRFPDHQAYKNNQVNKDYAHDGSRYIWIFDPLDGVANFQAGIPIWGISLALIENFWPIFGVFYMPATGDLFHARADQKAFWGDDEIRVSNKKNINDESLLFTYSRFHQHYRSTFPGKIRDLGCTGAHICYVAMGRAEAAVIANVTYQDLAAAGIILEAAGGKICKLDGSDFFLNEYLDGQKIHEHLLVMAPGIYSQVRNSLREIT
ncbi:MAG: inositol monophosphatase family protein [Desulfobacterales bacterium]